MCDLPVPGIEDSGANLDIAAMKSRADKFALTLPLGYSATALSNKQEEP
jgi:hypothetical protein